MREYRDRQQRQADLVRAAGIVAAPGDGSVHYHDLRHSFARRAARAGVRIDTARLKGLSDSFVITAA